MFKPIFYIHRCCAAIRPIAVWAVFFSLMGILTIAPDHTSLAQYKHLPQESYNRIRAQYTQGLTPKKVITVSATAYSSTPEQTDSTPCIAAKGFPLCTHNTENVIAANFLDIGTKVRFPDIYPNKTFTVVDRMNKRYTGYHVDFWVKTTQDAREFGVQQLLMEVY